MAEKSLRQRLDQRLSALKNDRATWETSYAELADFILPRAYRKNQSERNRGDKKQSRIINGAATFALKIVTAGLVSGLTSPAMPWMRIKADDQSLDEIESVKQWVSAVQEQINRVLAKSRFYQTSPMAYTDLVLFGTGGWMHDKDRETVSRFTPLTCGEYYVANENTGRIGTLYREFDMTVEMLAREFGPERLSMAARKAWDEGRYDTSFTVRHAVEAAGPLTEGQAKRWPIISAYWQAEGDEDDMLRVAGFSERPFQAARWDVTGTDAYGRSPAMDALPDVKMLQVMAKAHSAAVHRASRPPLTGPVLPNRELDLQPDAYNPVGAGGGQVLSVFPDAWKSAQVLGEQIKELEARIYRHFGADMFLVAIGSDKDMTATEVMARSEEKLTQLGPVVTRISDDLLRPTVDRIFNILIEESVRRWAQGMPAPLPPPPPELQGQELEIEFVSPLQAAQRGYGATALTRVIQFIGGVSQFQPAVLDKLDADQAVDEYADALGVDPTVIAGDDKVQEIRSARQQQQQQQAAQQALMMGADAAGKLGKAQVTPDTALGQLMGQMQGAAQ